jgi:hypothetical protein
VFLSTCATTISSAGAGVAVIANPEASNNAAPNAFRILLSIVQRCGEQKLPKHMQKQYGVQ